MNKISRILAVFVIPFFSVSGSLAQEKQTPTEQPNQDKYRQLEEELGKEARGKSMTRAKGLVVRELRGRAAGKPPKSMPAAKFITSKQWAEMKETPKSGLFIVDTDFVPPGLENKLKEMGLAHGKDGSLTYKGEPATLFVGGHVYASKKSIPGTPDGEDGNQKNGGGGGGAQLPADLKENRLLNYARRVLDMTGWALARLGDATDLLLVSKAHASDPFPWRCHSWYWAYLYYGGFCRHLDAWTWANAYGANPADGSCNAPIPYTRIGYISAYASQSYTEDHRYYFNADRAGAHASYDAGCGWPPVSRGTVHRVFMMDGWYPGGQYFYVQYVR